MTKYYLTKIIYNGLTYFLYGIATMKMVSCFLINGC